MDKGEGKVNLLLGLWLGYALACGTEDERDLARCMLAALIVIGIVLIALLAICRAIEA